MTTPVETSAKPVAEPAAKVSAKKKIVKLVKPVCDEKRLGDAAYAAEFEELMAKYTKTMAKREKERIKRAEHAAKQTPEEKKQESLRGHARDYLKHRREDAKPTRSPASEDDSKQLDRAIHLIILMKDVVPEGLDAEAIIKLADSLAKETRPDETIKDRETRIRKSMERAKQMAASKVVVAAK